jgi:hypothetical protein
VKTENQPYHVAFHLSIYDKKNHLTNRCIGIGGYRQLKIAGNRALIFLFQSCQTNTMSHIRFYFQPKENKNTWTTTNRHQLKANLFRLVLVSIANII